jgi:hypothetical protein
MERGVLQPPSIAKIKCHRRSPEPHPRGAAVHEEASQGSFKSNREKDVLTHALGNMEHPGRT